MSRTEAVNCVAETSALGETVQILVVDRDSINRNRLERRLRRAGFSVTVAADEDVSILATPASLCFDVVIVDSSAVDLEGLAVLGELSAAGQAPEVIVTSATPSIGEAVVAVRHGAFDYLPKPLAAEGLESAVGRAAERRRKRQDRGTGSGTLARRQGPAEVVGESAPIKAALARLRTIAPFSTTVLFTGETGTGKGLMAKTLHRWSPRSAKPFIQVNCGALQETLFESELFGYRRGAFTGAVSNRSGLFEAAQGGTLFLDEIAELSPAMQAKLLQVIDSAEIRPVGATGSRRIDVRLVTATNKDLRREVQAKRFRKDLYYRLNVVTVDLPPLRHRPADIRALIEHYLHQYQKDGQPGKTITPRATDALCSYPWPGNVRELANVLETLVVLAPGKAIVPGDLPPRIHAGAANGANGLGRRLSLKDVERRHIARTLEFTGGHKARATRILQIDAKTLNRKIQTYGIKVMPSASRIRIPGFRCQSSQREDARCRPQRLPTPYLRTSDRSPRPPFRAISSHQHRDRSRGLPVVRKSDASMASFAHSGHGAARRCSDRVAESVPKDARRDYPGSSRAKGTKGSLGG